MWEANELGTMTRIPRAVLLREAVDDLLEKHRVIWSRSRTGVHRSRSGGEAPAAARRVGAAASFQAPGGSL